jgi:hypothetical protein
MSSSIDGGPHRAGSSSDPSPRSGRLGRPRLPSVPTAGPWALAFPLAVAIASRAYSAALLLVLPTPGMTSPFLTRYHSTFAGWDAQWYLHIALTGYHDVPQQFALHGGDRYDFAFYPGWPFLLALGDRTGLPPDIVAVVLANVLFVLAAVAVYLVVAGRFSVPVARRTTLLLSFAPAAYVFTMGYSEPLFILLVATYFGLRGHPVRALAAGAAMLVRVTGLAILASAIATLWVDRGRWRELVASAALVVIGFGAWFGFAAWLMQRPNGWFLGSPSWLPVDGIPQVIQMLSAPKPIELAWMAVVVVMLVASLALIRRDVELGAYSAVAIAMSIVGAPVYSMPRHTLVAFPALALIGERIGRRGTITLVVASAVLEAWFVTGVFGPGLVAP